jgi:DnaJ-domain-containing protein 1
MGLTGLELWWLVGLGCGLLVLLVAAGSVVWLLISKHNRRILRDRPERLRQEREEEERERARRALRLEEEERELRQRVRTERRLHEQRERAAHEKKHDGNARSSRSSTGGGNAVAGVPDTLAARFATLGIPVDATDEQIKTAYRDLAMAWHPDRLTDGDSQRKKRAEERFKTIQEAYTYIQENKPPPPVVGDTGEISLRKNVDCSINGDAIVSSLNSEVVGIAAAIIELNARGMSLTRQMASGRLNREEACLAVNKYLMLQQDTANRVQKLIDRFERELPTFPTSELESNLATVTQLGVELREIAANAGIIPTR